MTQLTLWDQTLSLWTPASPISPVQVDKMPARVMRAKMDSVADGDTHELFLQKEVLNSTIGKQKMKQHDMIEIIVTKEDATNFVEQTSVAVIGFFSDKNCKIVEDFIKLDENDSVKFAISYEKEIFELFGIEKESTILILHKGDGAMYEIAGFLTTERMQSFISVNTLPLLLPLSSATSKFVSECPIQNHLYLLISQGSQLSQFSQKVIPIAKLFRGEILFCTVDVALKENETFCKFKTSFNSDLPTIVFSKPVQNMISYKLETSDDEIKKKIKIFFQLFGISDLDKNLMNKPHEHWLNGDKKTSVDIVDSAIDLHLAIKLLRKELEDANSLIASLRNVDNNLPSETSNFIKSNPVTVTTLYTNMVAMEKQLRDEIRAKEGIASELKESQISLQQVVSDIMIIKSVKG